MKLKTIKLTSLTASLKGHPEAAEETYYNGVGAGLRWGGGEGQTTRAVLTAQCHIILRNMSAYYLKEVSKHI